MDHNLGDSLNLENAMGVDFEHSEDVEVSQADVELEPSSHEEGMAMEFDHIEEQPMLMDTGNEEIIDFMGGQFTLQELSVDNDQMTGSEVTVDSSESQNIENTLSSHSDTMIDMSFAHPSISIPAAAGNVLNNFGSRIVSVESSTPETIVCKTVAPSNKPARTEVRLAPRQVAIAPKPPRPTVTKALPKFVPGKQFAIAPKPKPVSLVKKVSLSTAMQANAKGNTVIAQIGKQFVMLPSGDVNKKIKLVAAGTGVPTMRLVKSADNEQAQLIPNQNASKAKPTKFIIQGQNSSDPSQSSAVITKLLPSGGVAQAGARLVTVPQKVPISINNKMIIQSPIKHGMKLTASTQLVGGKSPVRLLPTPPASQGNTTTTKKIVITSHSGGQNVVLKSTATQKTAQLTKTIAGGQKTQLHPINVPGKGIQYIRLVTNSTTTAPTAVVKSSIKPAPPAKTFVITDSKGNLIQMTAEKMLSGQPPPLLITGNADSAKKIPAKPQQRLVRIAPVTSKSQVVMQKDPVRSGQSLLAPISVATNQPSEPSYDDVRQPPPTDVIQRAFEKEQSQVGDVMQQLDQPQESVTLYDMKAEVLQKEAEEETVENETMEEYREDTREEDVITQHVDVAEEQEVDSKASLHELIADAVSSPTAPAGNFASMPVHSVQPAQAALPVHSVHSAPARAPPEIHVSFERQHEGESRVQHLNESPTPREGDHPLIVIPSFLRNDVPANTDAAQAEPRRLISIEVDPYNAYQSSSPPLPDVTDTDINNELGLRPRKACNCTKSQCLKLYCDCFANGEFCNMCNCNNCHNNLENEELRQKAIRGCLDRNPNAFRPKIGKARSAGPDLVRRHNKGCNCKRSGCLKNYCECYEAKIACSSMCKCVGCRNVEEAVSRARRRSPPRRLPPRQPPPQDKQPCSFMTSEVIEAVCQCLVAAAAESNNEPAPDPLSDVIQEFARCLQDIISASNHAAFDEVPISRTKHSYNYDRTSLWLDIHPIAGTGSYAPNIKSKY